jgi:hypothetical protein
VVSGSRNGRFCGSGFRAGAGAVDQLSNTGIPRTPDGKPNLNAPAPRTSDGKPDLSGAWGISAGKYLMNIAADLKPTDVRPWAMENVKRSFANLGRDNPGTNCLPNGPETIMNGSLPKKILQMPNLIVILEETLEYRQIFLDGRPLPKDPNPSFKGDSVGHWEGDTLVVESTGFNGRNWLDVMGHPHSEELRLTERFRRTKFGRLERATICRIPICSSTLVWRTRRIAHTLRAQPPR